MGVTLCIACIFKAHCNWLSLNYYIREHKTYSQTLVYCLRMCAEVYLYNANIWQLFGWSIYYSIVKLTCLGNPYLTPSLPPSLLPSLAPVHISSDCGRERASERRLRRRPTTRATGAKLPRLKESDWRTDAGKRPQLADKWYSLREIYWVYVSCDSWNLCRFSSRKCWRKESHKFISMYIF